MDKIKSLGGAGILTTADLPDLSAAAARVEKLMKDGRWHTATEIIRAAGQREGLRRMRELRKRYVIDRQREISSREFTYRIARTVPKPGQQSLPLGE